jgi:predicted alpha/beta-hydrolase family hydrolase
MDAMPENAILLTHGAGSDRNAALLVALAGAFEAAGWLAERMDLPFRKQRRKGPPRPGDAGRDREGIRDALAALRDRVPGRVVAGGHSYGGRQCSMLLAEEPALADALLLLSYPLHPPGKPDQARTAHLPRLRIPAVFVHGTRDPFGSPEEMRAAAGTIPAASMVIFVEGAGHDLAGAEMPRIVRAVDGGLQQWGLSGQPSPE